MHIIRRSNNEQQQKENTNGENGRERDRKKPTHTHNHVELNFIQMHLHSFANAYIAYSLQLKIELINHTDNDSIWHMQLKFLLRAFGVHVKKVKRVNVRREKPHTHTLELMRLCVQFNAYLVFHRIFSMQSKFIHKKCARNTHTLSHTHRSAFSTAKIRKTFVINWIVYLKCRMKTNYSSTR